MKRLIVILIGLFVFSLSACDHSDNDAKSNIISASDLNERENAIISITSDQSFVFDYEIDAEYKEVALWIEKYKTGQLVDDKLGYMTTQLDETSGTIILATSKTDDKDRAQTYYMGVGDKDGTASIVVTDTKSKDVKYMSIVSGQLTDEKTLNDKENVLATIAYSNDEFGVSSISNGFYHDPDAHLDELNNYDIVSLFKVKFIK